MKKRGRSVLARMFLVGKVCLVVVFIATMFALAGFSGGEAATVGTYENAAIADIALTYKDQWGGEACADARVKGRTLPGDGQCRNFISCIVFLVSGGKQELNTRGGDYFKPFLEQGGVEIKSVDNLSKGDIVQVGQGGHTFIIVSRVAGNKFWVVDSNHLNKSRPEVVLYYLRENVTLDGKNSRAFRMGRTGADQVDLSVYSGHIVQWDGDTKAQKTAWLVTSDLHRIHIPSIPVYYCLKEKGAPGPDVLPAGILDRLPDRGGTQAICETPPEASEFPTTDAAAGAPRPKTRVVAKEKPQDVAPVTSSHQLISEVRAQPEKEYAQPNESSQSQPDSQPKPAPERQRWQQQQATRGTDTFLNYHNASGKGPRIDPRVWVTVTCRTHDPYISSNSGGWWYLVFTSPWSDQYWAPASTFWNGDVEGQTPYTHNVDESVAVC